MTVQVRPIPGRIQGNNIKPFQAVRPANNIRPYTLETWKPPVPEPLPPAPLLGIPSLLALGALVLSQVWGLFQPPPRSTPDPILGPEGPRKTTGEIRLDRILRGSFVGAYVTNIGEVLTTSAESAVTSDGTPFFRFGITYRRNDTGNVVSLPIGTAISVPSENDWARFVQVSGTVLNPGIQGEPLFSPVVPEIAPEPDIVPSPGVSPKEVERLRPVPLPLPGGEDLPDPLNPQPAGSPQQLPAIGRPLAPPLLRPAPAGTTVRPVTPYLPAAAPAVTTTPADVHFPAPGVPITSNPPAATLQSIAQEVGRIENKVNRLLNPAAGTGLDKLELIRGTLLTLLDFLTSITGGGSYDLEAPCETAGGGGPLVVEHPYSGALNSVLLLHNKMDALAALVQTHKNMRQPICKPAPPTGQPVTVQFEEV